MRVFEPRYHSSVTLRTVSALIASIFAGPSSSFAQSPADQTDQTALLHDLTADFDRLAPQTIRPADGYIQHPYLIPAGYYNQMWDWDGFFIGLHWANQDPANAKYLRDWVLGFAGSADADGYVAGCITPKGPRPLFGKFAMKPFLAQGALIAARDLNDYEWIRPVWPAMKRVLEYRRRTQYDEKWKLWFWDNAMQSGADNNAALTNDEKDRSAILAVDASVYAMREYAAMATLAEQLGDPVDAKAYRAEVLSTRHAILRQLWSARDAMFWNRRRDTGAIVRVVAWSNFLPLVDGLLPRDEGRRMISAYLLNRPRCARNTDYAACRALIPPTTTRPSSILIPTGAAPSGSMPIFSTGLRCDDMDSTTKLTGWPSRSPPISIATSQKWGSMHEDYDAETGDGLAPTVAQSPGGKFAGFVGWNLLAEDMLQCEVTTQHCMTLAIDDHELESQPNGCTILWNLRSDLVFQG